jgi:hypothetical protein
MEYNNISIEEVIAKVSMNLGLGDNEIPKYDFIEWIADAMKHIGVINTFENKTISVEIQDYCGQLPKDLLNLVKIESATAYNNTNDLYLDLNIANIQQLRYNIDDLTRRLITETDPLVIKSISISIADLKADLEYQSSKIQAGVSSTITINSKYLGLNLNPNLRLDKIEKTKITNLDYKLEMNTITTSFRFGVVTLIYQGLHLDSNGFPTVPNDISFIDACQWKIAYQLGMRGFKFKNQTMNDLLFTSAKWQFYCGQARGSAMMPNVENMERLKNIWYTLMPDVNQYRIGFKNLGLEQRISGDKR